MVDGKIVDGLVRITRGHHIWKGRFSWTMFLNVKEKVKQKESWVILTYPTKCVHVFPLSMYILTVIEKNYAVITTDPFNKHNKSSGRSRWRPHYCDHQLCCFFMSGQHEQVWHFNFRMYASWNITVHSTCTL